MIIKKVPFCEERDDRGSLPIEEKGTSPRIVIKMKKSMKVQHKDQNSLDVLNQGESVHFNDNDYFSDQFRLLKTQKIGKEVGKYKSYIRQMKPQKQPSKNETKYRLNQVYNSEHEFSRRAFLQTLKKETIQTTLAGRFLYPEINLSQGNNRGRFCNSQRMKQISIPSTEGMRQPTEIQQKKGTLNQSQLEALKEYSRLNIKLSNENKSCLEVNPYTNKEYFHQRVTQSCNQRRSKKFNSLDYSIIKPNQIKAVPLSQRNDDKAVFAKRKNDRRHFPELIAALRRKEDLQAERQRARQELRRAEIRSNIHTSYVPMLNIAKMQEKNELVPWQVQGSTNVDFL